MSKTPSKFLPGVIGAVAVTAAGALGYYAPGRSRLWSHVRRGVLGVVGLVADVANMMSGKGGNTATGALIGAAVGGVAGGLFGTSHIRRRAWRWVWRPRYRRASSVR